MENQIIEEKPFNYSLFYGLVIGITILLTLYIIILYIRLRMSMKNKDPEIIKAITYPCYLNIFLSGSILINNLLRVIRFGSSKKDFSCEFQAFCLMLFDKMIILSLTVNAYLTYRGLSDNQYYMNNIKKLFVVSYCIAFIVSILSAVLFISQGVVRNDNICYGQETQFKNIYENVMNSFIFLINLFCNLKSMLFVVNITKELVLKKIDIKAYRRHYIRMLLTIYVSGALFAISFLIINNSLFTTDNYIDLSYVTACLLVNLFFTVNSMTIRETLILFGCKKREIPEEVGPMLDTSEEKEMLYES